MPVLRVVISLRRRNSQATHGCRRSKARECLSPKAFRLVEILLAQPRDVVSIGESVWQLQLLTTCEGFIKREDLLGDLHCAPAVHEYVMMAPDEVITVSTHSDESQTQQRRLQEIKTALTICFEVSLQPLLLLGS